MKRRDFLIGAAGAGAALAAPHIARAAGKPLKFVPQANLANLDPIWGTQYVVRNASLMIWDTLYGVDATLTPKPQMAEGHEVSDDGKTWTFKLRSGLKWHDGEPVTSKDCVASIKRWSMRDTMGALIRKQLVAIEPIDDRSFRIVMTKPFGKMLFAIGKSNSPACFIMPERIANTDPFKQITEIVGSGPMRFVRDEWVPGSHAAFAKFDAYVPRDEPTNWISGGKRMLLDRIDWQILPDPATAAAALQNGEVDWWETPLPDLIPLLKRSGKINVDIADPLGNIGSFRMNHLYPPFNDVRARQAMLMALDQTEYMTAVTGGDETLMRTCPSYFTPGTALYTEAGGDLLKGPRKYDEAKKLLEASGYKGEPVVLLVATDIAITKAEGDVTADALKRIGMNVDYVALDWGTVGQRRAKKDPPDKGGWNIFHTWHAGADCVNPAPYTALDASGDTAWFGWPKSDAVQAAIHEWYDAAPGDAEKAAIEKVNRASFENVTYVPTGFFLGYQAWRKEVSGVVKAPFPVFWGVTKA
ncbi:MAG TPA: ABC transporter substrate-binding protein [Acidisphaera sp.]|nr:ABC transporter substrate-binding protein [Acidisphaera sp.]